MRWELGGKKIASCTLIQMSWGGQLPMEIIDSCNRRDIDSYDESIDDSPIVKAPTSIPVAGTRESARLEERSVRRLSLMRNAQAYDCERLGYRFVKRCFDIVFSAAVITVAFVPSLVLCAAIAIESPGCPLYRQKRVGRIGADGKPREFTMWKFRSMVKGADKMKDALLAENEVEGPMFKMKDDPRVTRIGHFIRKHSIDEFPQFLNVLVGDIPLRILKTRPEFSEKSMGAFALPAKSSTNKGKAFSQVVSCFANGLRMRRISKFNCNRIRGMEAQFLAKPVFGAVCA